MPDKTDTTDTQKVEEQQAAEATTDATANAVNDETLSKMMEKVDDADSILVVLSKDPSVDEMAAAIALTLSLDRMGKHATAIYSGKTPNALEFLEPEKTFETNTNSLQDFIIALDKEKADHLRYKIEGDYVKVYITPYRTTISEDDLEFSHGEVNVDMVISFNVPTPEDLDAALAQHGRIMHDAVSINISNKIPGRLGGIEWNDPNASSVSEMVLKFLNAEAQNIEKDVATALLTGIVAETERFSNDKTTPDTMAASAELMQKGADQQIVVSHIEELQAPSPEVPAEEPKQAEKQPEPGSIDVSHEDEQSEEGKSEDTETLSVAKGSENIEPEMAKVPEVSEPEMTPAEGTEVATTANLANVPVDAGNVDNTISPEAQLEQMIGGSAPVASEPVEPASVAGIMSEPVTAPATEPAPTMSDAPTIEPISTANEVPATEPAPMMGEVSNPIMNVVPDVAAAPEAPSADIANVGMANVPVPETQGVAAVPTTAMPVEQIYSTPDDTVNMNDGVLSPVEEEHPKDYGAMMEQELAEPEVNQPVAPVAPTAPVAPASPASPASPEMVQPMPMSPVSTDINPAINAAPMAPAMPEVQPITPIAPAAPDAPVASGAELPPPPVPEMGYNMMPPTEMNAEMAMAQAPVVNEPTNTMSADAMPAVAMPAPATPTPAQDTSAALGIPEAPEGVAPPPEPVNPVVVQPIQDPASVPPVQDPGSFKIPGM